MELNVVSLPEIASALCACRLVARAIEGDDVDNPNPLFVHGAPGTGKTRLVQVLMDAVDCDRLLLSACSFPLPWDEEPAKADQLARARSCDLLIVEDLQHLPVRAIEPLVQVLDGRLAMARSTVVTATSGPAGLAHRGDPLPRRLVNRLAGGLVIGLQQLQASSRLCLLREMAAKRMMRCSEPVLCWLADVLVGGGRQLEGALNQVAALEALCGRPLTLNDVQSNFEGQIGKSYPAVERIIDRVSTYFAVEPGQMLSSCRERRLRVPRQIGMYLARTLTRLSLQQIGAYFGDRDHTTVLHACRKIEEVLKHDAALSGTVRQLHAELM